MVALLWAVAQILMADNPKPEKAEKGLRLIDSQLRQIVSVYLRNGAKPQ